MARRSKIQKYILSYLKETKRPVTYEELYSNSSFSEQGIRNRAAMMVKEGLIEKKITGAGRTKVKVTFVLRT